MTTKNPTEKTLRSASKKLAKAVCGIRKSDPELADRISRSLMRLIQEYREVKASDADAVACEARMLESAA